MTGAALAFAVLLPAMLVAHDVADHWLQTHHQAITKGQAGWAGRAACAAHVSSYTATTMLVALACVLVFDLSVSPLGFALGQAVSAVTHYVADRRWPLERLTGWLRPMGKDQFYRLGSDLPRPHLGTGAYALDQSWHRLWLLVAVFVTVLV